MGGVNGTLCKHLIALIEGDASFLCIPEDAELYRGNYSRISTSHLFASYLEVRAALDNLHRRKKDLDKEANIIKKMFVRQMSEGL
jgi:hypothetical protein